MAARFAFRRLSTQVMKQVTSAEGPVVSKGRLPLRPRGNLAAPQARNASGAASEGSGTDTAGARSKGTTGKDVNVSNSRSGETLDLPGGVKLNFHFQNGPSQRPWLYITGVGTAMGALGTYVGYKVGKAAGMLWGPVEAVGEKYAAAKEKVRSKTEAWKERLKSAPVRANPSEAERENGVQVSPVTVNRGNAEAEKRGAGLQRTESGTVSRGGFPTESGSESASGEKEGGWRAAAKAAVAEKKKRFEKLLEQKDGKTKSAS